MTKQALATKMNDKYIGVFPLEFDDQAEDSAVAIPDTIQLIPIGQWEHDLYGPILITAGDIGEFIRNFDAGVRKGVYITAGHEGMSELPAQGWIVSLEARDTGLWGKVEWNDLGVETLSDKQYKFFSPEFCRDFEDPQTHVIYRNVLMGGALTKSPYFKELEAVVFSDKNIKKQFNEKTMDLKDIVAKKIEDLTDAEKAFVVEHKAELTEEQKTALTSIIDVETAEQKDAREAKEKGDANEAAGLNRDGSQKEAPAPAPEAPVVEGSDKKMVTINASELALLKAAADKGMQAFKELEGNKLAVAVGALMFSDSNKAGKFLPKSKDNLRAFMETLNPEQRTKFSALISELPKSTEIFNEIGNGGAVDGTAKAELDAKVEAKQKANPKMSYSEALKEVFSETKGLEERYNGELPSAKTSVKA